MAKFISTLDEYFGQKAPQLPTEIKEWIVKASPYLAILGLIAFGLGFFPLLSFLLFGYGMMGLYTAYVPMTNIYLSLIVLIVVELMYLLAIPGLFKRTKKAWTWLFYAQIVTAINFLVGLNIIGAVVILAISFYFLFQVKSLYIN